MTLMTRFSRLFKADLHAVFDRIEEPDLVLKQAVREMEEDLARDRQGIRLLQEEGRRLDARDAEVAGSLAGIGEELDICFAAGKDDLARALIKRRLEGERLRGLLDRRRAGLADTLARLETRARANGARLDAMRHKAELLIADEPVGAATDRWGAPDLSVRDEDVEVAFLRERQRRARP